MLGTCVAVGNRWGKRHVSRSVCWCAWGIAICVGCSCARLYGVPWITNSQPLKVQVQHLWKEV